MKEFRKNKKFWSFGKKTDWKSRTDNAPYNATAWPYFDFAAQVDKQFDFANIEKVKEVLDIQTGNCGGKAQVFIFFGGSGAGKTTQSKNLVRYLAEHFAKFDFKLSYQFLELYRGKQFNLNENCQPGVKTRAGQGFYDECFMLNVPDDENPDPVVPPRCEKDLYAKVESPYYKNCNANSANFIDISSSFQNSATRYQKIDMTNKEGAKTTEPILVPAGDYVKGMNEFEYGLMKRVTKATMFNPASSRSHAVFTIKAESQTSKKESCLYVVGDLAGYEKYFLFSEEKVKKEGESLVGGINAVGEALEDLSKPRAEGFEAFKGNHPLLSMLHLPDNGFLNAMFFVCINLCGPPEGRLEDTFRSIGIGNQAAGNKQPFGDPVCEGPCHHGDWDKECQKCECDEFWSEADCNTELSDRPRDSISNKAPVS